MRILVVSSNTSDVVTGKITAAARGAASPGTEIVPVTSTFGARLVESAAPDGRGAHPGLDRESVAAAGELVAVEPAVARCFAGVDR